MLFLHFDDTPYVFRYAVVRDIRHSTAKVLLRHRRDCVLNRDSDDDNAPALSSVLPRGRACEFEFDL